MKTIIKYFRIIILLVVAFQINSCTEPDTEPDTPPETTGEAMFWIASDLGVGSITVSCNGVSRTFNNYYSSGAPNCGATGAANFTLNPGTYNYTASGGTKTWSGSITVNSGGCSKMQLTASGGGTSGGGGSGTTSGQAMFWIASDLGVGAISVTCNGSTKTFNSFYNSGAPACGATGVANFTLNPGTYSYTASGGTLKWSGTITVTSGGCFKMQLTGSGGGGTGTNLSINGKWQGSDGRIITISGSSGVFNSFGTGIWKSAADKGIVKVGDLFLRNISNVNSTKWNSQQLWLQNTNGVPSSVKWGADGTIMISSNGNSFTLTSTNPDNGVSGSITFTRVN